jgi:hypothetical protein
MCLIGEEKIDLLGLSFIVTGAAMMVRVCGGLVKATPVGFMASPKPHSSRLTGQLSLVV